MGLFPVQLDFREGDSLRARFARGAVWSLIGAVISQGLGLAASVVAARLLGKTGFGELGMINSTVGMFGVVAGLGLGLTTTKYVAELRAVDPERAGKIIGLSSLAAMISSGVIAIGLFLFAPLLAARALAAPHLAPELRIGSLLLVLNTLTGVQTGTLSGFEAFKALAQANLARGLLSFPVLITGVFLGGLPGAVWSLTAAGGIGWLINHRMLRRMCAAAGMRARYRCAWDERRVLWSFSLPALLASAATVPANWLVNAMLVNRPNGYGEMGVFNAAGQWRTAILFLPGLVGQVVLPMLSSFRGEEGRRSARKLLLAAILVNAAFLLPALLPLLFWSGRIMSLYGAGFASRGAVLWITAITAGLLAVQTPVGNVIAAGGRMWLGALMNLGWGVVLLISTGAFLDRGWGADGAAAAYLVAYLFHAVWTFWFAGRVLGADRVRPGRSVPIALQEAVLDK